MSKTKLMYVVFEEAIMRHGIVGVFDNKALAKREAKKAAERSDGHHSYNVLPVPLNINQMPIAKDDDGRRWNTPKELDTCSQFTREQDGSISES